MISKTDNLIQAQSDFSNRSYNLSDAIRSVVQLQLIHCREGGAVSHTRFALEEGEQLNNRNYRF